MIAVEGCAHGDLDNIYASLQHLEESENIKIDLLICCGDFQAVRNENDLESMACPVKYRTMNTFWKYYSGEEVAPVPTLFVGGNHEASNYLWELYYGGWVAPKIFFMGFAGVIKFGSVRIGGLSGIFNARDYYSGHYERAPYNNSDIRSIYHVREYDVHKLKQVEEPLDIFISHDWPRGITAFGNSEQLLRHKPFFESEIKDGTLGSRAAEELLKKLKPSYWFSAHLHTKFAALVQHGENGPVTKFLALDKCLPGRNFLQVIEIKSDAGPHEIHYDEEWLAITRAYNPVFPLSRKPARLMPELPDLKGHRQWVQRHLEVHMKPFDFRPTVPAYDPTQRQPISVGHVRNPQTEALLQLLELSYVLDSSLESGTQKSSPISSMMSVKDPSEIILDDADDDSLPDDVDEIEASSEDTVDPNDVALEEDLS
ncbi:lariat debranching enzyme isoform X2 [Cryptomeria japonica]|uniref:lariat debranching enzyme isoform X2 n=1 Tax=Cryptomeria japonica TaxID=3369 RepID=UPI0027DA6360|nr:lariat debranching enzyme isoform X2 [Cryptomeria japonica]